MAGGLDTRRRRLTKDNQHLIPHSWQPAGDLSVFGGMGREPKKTPPLCLPLVWHCFAATRSALFNEQGIPQMIFTFLIQHSRTCRLADLRRIRTVTAVADTEAQARAALAGLPLVFVSRRPSGEVAA